MELETGNINKAYTMTATERKKLQRDFLRRVGPNAETFKALFDTLPDATFDMMDDQDRIMAYNRRNCENSNIRSEAEIVGKKSSEVFPAVLAEVYMARDREVRRTGKPILNRVYGHGADRSTDLRIVNIYPLRDALIAKGAKVEYLELDDVHAFPGSRFKVAEFTAKAIAECEGE